MDKTGQFGQIITRQLEGESLVKIARELGVSRTTLYAWRADPAYRLLEAELHRQAIAASYSDVRAMVAEAVDILRRAMRGEFFDPADARIRLMAARDVLELNKALGSPGDDDLGESDLDELIDRCGLQHKPRAEGN